MRAADELGVVSVHPVGIRLTQPGPVIAGTLGVTGEPDKTVIQIHAAGAGAAFEFRLAKTGGDFLHIHHLIVDGENGIDLVQIRRGVAPELGVGQLAAGGEDLALAADKVGGFAGKFGADLAGGVHDHGGEGDGLLVAAFIAHLGFHVDVAGFAGHGNIGGIDVDAGGLEIFVEREGLIDLAGEVQPDVVVQAPVIGVEGAPHPFVAGAGGFFHVVVAVVHFYGDHVIGVAEVHEVGQVEAAGGDAVFEAADELAVYPEAAGLFESFKFEEHLFALGGGGELEMFPVPGDAHVFMLFAAAVRNDFVVGIGVVVRVRGGNGSPGGIVEGRLFGIGDIALKEFPAGVEIIIGVGRGGRRVGWVRPEERSEREGQQDQSRGQDTWIHG